MHLYTTDIYILVTRTYLIKNFKRFTLKQINKEILDSKKTRRISRNLQYPTSNCHTKIKKT